MIGGGDGRALGPLPTGGDFTTSRPIVDGIN